MCSQEYVRGERILRGRGPLYAVGSPGEPLAWGCNCTGMRTTTPRIGYTDRVDSRVNFTGGWSKSYEKAELEKA